jgi:hypothetical protein
VTEEQGDAIISLMTAEAARLDALGIVLSKCLLSLEVCCLLLLVLVAFSIAFGGKRS